MIALAMEITNAFLAAALVRSRCCRKGALPSDLVMELTLELQLRSMIVTPDCSVFEQSPVTASWSFLSSDVTNRYRIDITRS